MNRISKLLLATSVALPLTACGSSSSAASVDAKEVYGCDTINVYNWGEYIGTDVLSNFEKEYNAKVNYDLFESNEIMYTKLLGGSSYDVLVPSDYMVERLIKEGLVQPLDFEAIPNFSQISAQALSMREGYDPEGKYTVPYFWGSVGLVYNKETVDPAVIEEKGWDILHDTDYKGRIFIYDSQRDSFMMAFKALGYSMNTENENEIQEAYEWLQQMNDTMDPAYVTDEVIDEMVNGNKDIAVVYSGDAAYILSENEDMAYLEPKQGTNIWSDAMVIPQNAGCPALANAFINFVTDYESAYDNSATVGYSSSNEAVQKELSSTDYDGINAYSPREGYDKDEIFSFNEVLTLKLSDLWNKVKISQ